MSARRRRLSLRCAAGDHDRAAHTWTSDALGAARAVYGLAFNLMLTLKSLCFADGDLATLPGDMCPRLVEAASNVNPARLPKFAYLAGVAPGASR